MHNAKEINNGTKKLHLLTPLLSTKERLRPWLNVQSVAGDPTVRRSICAGMR